MWIYHPFQKITVPFEDKETNNSADVLYKVINDLKKRKQTHINMNLYWQTLLN